MSEPIQQPAGPEATRRTVLARGELSLTLVASADDWPHSLRDVANALRHTDGMLRAIAKQVAPEEPMLPVLIRVDIIDERIRLVVRMDKARPRKRRKP